MSVYSPHAELRKSAVTVSIAVTLVCFFVGIWGVAFIRNVRMTARLTGMLEVLSAVDGDVPLPVPPEGLRLLRLDPGARVVDDTAPGEAFRAGSEILEGLVSGTGKAYQSPWMTVARPRKDDAGALLGFDVARGYLPAMPGVGAPIFLLWILGCVTAGVLVGVFSWAASRPRRELMDATARLMQGEVREPLRLDAGHPYRSVADAFNDFTDSLERQRRVISEQHHQQQVLLNNISEGILVLDNELLITGINPIASQWLETGHPLRAQGKALYKLCRNPTLLTMIDALLETVEMKEAHLTLERPGEEDRLVELRGSLLIDRDQAVGVLILMRDVTTLRRLETLRQDFVANVSHELRTPLTSIKGYAELLEDETDDPEAVLRYGSKIVNQSTRMVNIIDDLLALTRIESAHAPPAIAVTELPPLLENVVQLCEEAAARRNLQLVLEVSEAIRLPVHAPLIEQAVHNLVQNAIKYTHPATKITIGAFLREDQCVIEVRDEGPGIAPQHHARLFERFYRVDKARSRAVGGTGLGLSIVKHIAMLHQGRVEVESTLGGGATFRIFLPINEKPVT